MEDIGVQSAEENICSNDGRRKRQGRKMHDKKFSSIITTETKQGKYIIKLYEILMRKPEEIQNLDLGTYQRIILRQILITWDMKM